MITIYYESNESLILQALLGKCTKFFNRLTYHNMYISIFFLNLGETCCNERKISSKLKIFPSSIQTVSHLTHCNGHA